MAKLISDAESNETGSTLNHMPRWYGEARVDSDIINRVIHCLEADQSAGAADAIAELAHLRKYF